MGRDVLGDIKAPSEYEYVIASLHLKNNNDQKITTNPIN
jgi:hypothetical protein